MSGLVFLLQLIFGPFCLLIAVIALVYRAARWLQEHVPKRWIRPLAAVSILAPPLLAWGAFTLYESRWARRVVPAQFEVTHAVYRKEERWGIPLFAMPGDNGTGLRVFELPKIAAQRLAHEGDAFLTALAHTPMASDDPRSEGRYSDWQPTPLDSTARQRVVSRCDPRAGEDAFCVEIDPEIWARMQHDINAPGGWWALGRSGVIVVVPGSRRVYYMYNG